MDALKIDDLIDEELVFLDEEADDAETLLRTLAGRALEKGYVKEGYAEAVLERERLYPTALPTEVLKVAVPHAMERDLVVRPVIVVATLKHPVNFKEMGEGVKDVPVDVVFLLAVCGSKDQLTILQKIVGMFSDASAMTDVKNAASRQDLITAIKAHLAA